MSDALISATVEEPEYDDHDWTRVDRQIIDAFGKKSIRQLSEETGVSQADLMRRKQELVDSVDVLTIQMQRMKLMATLQEAADYAFDVAKNAIDEYKAGAVNSAVAAIKELLKQLDRLERQGSGQIDSLNRMRVRELLGIVEEAVYTSVAVLSERHGIPEQDFLSEFQVRLADAAERRET